VRIMNTKEKVMLHKGMDKVKRMEFVEALEVFDRLLQVNSQIPEAWNNKGVALFRLGRPEEALECYGKTIVIDPDNLDALRNTGFVLRCQGKMEEALQAYDTVLQKGGDAIDFEATAGVLISLGKLEEAMNCLFLAKDMMPLDRFEEEIGILKGMILEKNTEKNNPAPEPGPGGEKGSHGLNPNNEGKNDGKE
jgi:tetratricopeptide (TPR) repeat protein